MSAPLLWILLPVIIAGLLYVFRRRTRFVKVGGILLALGLAVIAWQIPIGTAITLGPWTFLPQIFISDRLEVLGRQFILNNSARPALLIIYFGLSLWFIGSTTISITRLFIPLGLATAALLTAAVSVEPFLYAALLMEMAILLCIPILSPPGKKVSRGVLRFITFQTIGMMLLVLSGWMINEIELNPNNLPLIFRASVILVLGFAMGMSIFPFSIWIPMVTQDTHPYTAAFTIFFIPEVVALFAFAIFSRFAWLQSNALATQFFLLAGLIMIIGAGIWAAFQNNLGRIFGYAVITEIGLLLVSIGQIITSIPLIPSGTANLISEIPLAGFFFALLLPRGLNLAIWALGLTIIRKQTSNLEMDSVRGIIYTLPVACFSLLLASLSLAGYPLLAGYPIRFVIGTEITQNNIILGLSTLIGYFGLVIATMKSFANLIHTDHQRVWQISESRPQLILLYLGCLLLVGIGLFPQIYLSSVLTLLP